MANGVQVELEFDIVRATLVALNKRASMLETAIFNSLIKERTFAGCGYWTEFLESPFLKLDTPATDRYWQGPGYTIDKTTRIDCVVSLHGSCITQIEAYTYDVAWPEIIGEFKILTSEDLYRAALREN